MEKEKNKSICRWFDENMFADPDIKACLTNLAEYVESSTSKWHLEFRGNIVDLYCKGLVLPIDFKKNKKLYTIKGMSKKLKEALIHKKIAVEEYFEGRAFETFDELIGLLPIIQNVYEEYPFSKIQEERMLECKLAKGMNTAKQAFIVDVEVVVSKTAEYAAEGKARKTTSNPSNPEGDILLLVRKGLKYWFLPVEMKRADAGSGVLDDARGEIKSFMDVIYGDGGTKLGFFKEFRTNYTKVCHQKREIGLLKDADTDIDILAEKPEKPVGLILILTNGDKAETSHELTKIQKNSLYLISKPNDPNQIYCLKCDKEFFQSCKWLEQLQ